MRSTWPTTSAVCGRSRAMRVPAPVVSVPRRARAPAAWPRRPCRRPARAAGCRRRLGAVDAPVAARAAHAVAGGPTGARGRVPRRRPERRAEALVALLVGGERACRQRVAGCGGCHSQRPSTVSAQTARRARARAGGDQRQQPVGTTRSSSADGGDERASRPAAAACSSLARSTRARCGTAAAPAPSSAAAHVRAAPHRGRPAASAARRRQQRRDGAQVGAGAAGEVDHAPGFVARRPHRRNTSRRSERARPRRRAPRGRRPSRSASQSALKPLMPPAPLPHLLRAPRRNAAPPVASSAGAARARARRAGARCAQRRARRSRGAAHRAARPTSPGGTSTPASGGTVSRIAPAAAADHRQAVRQRLGQRHAVALVERRQHEHVGAA